MDDVVAEGLSDARRMPYSSVDVIIVRWFGDTTAAPRGDAGLARGALGCAFQVSAAEFPEPGHPAHGIALAHKESVRTLLRSLAAHVAQASQSQIAAMTSPT